SEEERFSRKKHDSGFPKNAIRFVLEEAKISAGDIDQIIFYEKPFLKFERIFKTVLATFPFAPRVFAEGIKGFFVDKLWIRQLISKELSVPSEKIFFSEHHLSHAAAGFFCSPYKKAAILTVDGVGEWACTTIGVGEENGIKILKEIRFPHSLGLLYSALTAFLGFEVNEGEYKVMGMAPYGKPRYTEKVRKLIRFFDDGSFALNLEYFAFHRSTSRAYSGKFLELFGEPRDPKSKFFTRESGWPSYFGPKPEGAEFERLADKQEYYADLAASLQAVLEEGVVRLAKEAKKITGCDKLCVAGGVWLNSVANWKILKQAGFSELFIQPAAGDAGGALGAALAFYHLKLGKPRGFVMEHAYYGKGYTDSEVLDFLKKEKIPYTHYPEEGKLIDVTVSALLAGKVVGWFQGKFEWGPRALGNRSILADARRTDMKDIVNTKIKFREPYRPFAPSVLAEHVEEFFEIENPASHSPARFMLYVVPVKEEKKKVIPAITHVDGTGRLQVVLKEHSPRYWNLIKAFADKTGVPLVLNTSFNLKGEPVVNTPAEAFSTFSRSGMDVLVLNNFVVEKK
ncbi:MAG: carbamoyltransferase C-terminal domain-containing protein, partial [Candidatus Liptonbacteria bacterium]|nr:carbamoyltransferase C-terminal domain-containing protein [Candidatus Liptonbacteria bacterium]